MKRLRQLLPVCFLLLITGAFAADIYVSPTGNDRNPGTRQQPLQNLSAAILKARELRRLNDASIKTGINIWLSAGTYPVMETIILRPEDSGTSESPTRIAALLGESPVLSGGVEIRGWKKVYSPFTGFTKESRQHVWVSDLPGVMGNPFTFRQLWVNNKKAVRAQSAKTGTLDRILHWDKATASCIIPALPFANLEYWKGLELFIHQWWEIAILRVKKMERYGDSVKVFFEAPESKIQNEHPWPAPWLSKETGNSAFTLVNALPLLDEPGEWYLDQEKQKLYYWPRKEEDIHTAKVIAPFTETLLRIQGTANSTVKHISIEGISFQHTGWLRPSQQGHVPHQLGLYMTEAYKLRPPGTPAKPALDNQAWIGRPPAAVEMNYTSEIGFRNCSVLHTASNGIDLVKGVKLAELNGNLLKDIGGNGILAGNFGEEGREIHLPYTAAKPNDLCFVISINNNMITDAGTEDWGCAGIAAGFVKLFSITNNELEFLPYTGISLGWGWTAEENMMDGNIVSRNKIHHFGMKNYDCAGIYTQSAQPNTSITANYIDSACKAPYAHLPSHWFYLYADEGTSGIKFTNNWTPTQKYLQNANGPGNQWNNNGPGAGDSIKQNAGLQNAYQHLLQLATPKTGLLINEEHPELIELVLKPGSTLDLPKLKNLLAANEMDSAALYQWQNHYVYFGKVADLSVMQGRLQNNFPGLEVRAYYDLFYEYRKRKHCGDPSEAKEWTHILLTANLVADPELQQEYLDAHATQFLKWPDVSNGFCRADFQQLLLFRNGRQLMLVISIPKGKTLDELNPKTVANNPKMVEWNKIMGKYQEGIPGTKKGESWVFLEKIGN